MKLKSYRAATLKACLEKIKRDLGPDAFIVGQKEVRPNGLLSLIRRAHVEVTAAIDHATSKPAEPQAPKAPLHSGGEEKTPQSHGIEAVRDELRLSRTAVVVEPQAEPAAEPFSGDSNTPNQALADEIQQLKAMVQSMSVNRPMAPVWIGPVSFPSKSGRKLCSSLLAQGVGEELAYSLAGAKDASPEAVAASLASQISVDHDWIPLKGKGREVVALLGPTGVGKTTTIAKLAALGSLRRKLRVALITLDTFRIAAIEQLKTYSEIMGLPLRVVADVRDLASAIESFADQDLVLIDTTGRNPRELSGDGQLAKFFSSSKEIRKALVLSATTKASDLQDIIERYEVFDPGCLIFTKLDETESHGPVVTALVRSGLPLAYVTIGQAVPQDILRPKERQIADLLLGPNRYESWNQLVASARQENVDLPASRGVRKNTKRQLTHDRSGISA